MHFGNYDLHFPTQNLLGWYFVSEADLADAQRARHVVHRQPRLPRVPAEGRRPLAGRVGARLRPNDHPDETAVERLQVSFSTSAAQIAANALQSYC